MNFQLPINILEPFLYLGRKPRQKGDLYNG